MQYKSSKLFQTNTQSTYEYGELPVIFFSDKCNQQDIKAFNLKGEKEAIIFEEENLLVFSNRFTLFSYDKGVIKESEYLVRDQFSRNLSKDVIRNSCFYEGAYIVSGNASRNNYYHWVSQVLASILFILKRSSDTKEDYPVNVIGPPLNNFSREYIDIIDNINYQEISQNSLCVVEKAFFTNFLWNDFDFSESKVKAGLYDSLIDRVKPSKSSKKRRIYISRKDTPRRKVKNEEDVISLLEEYGFEEVSLSGKSVKDQILLFSSSEAVVAPHGAGLTNLFFCSQGTVVIELLQENYLNRCFYAIAKSRGLNYTALVNPVILNGDDKHRDDILVDLELLQSQLSKIFSAQECQQ